MLEKEFKYYLDNQADLAKKYPNQFLVIIGDSVVGVYATRKEAYDKASTEYHLGDFLIQQAQLGDNNHTQIFHTRAIVNR